MKNTLTINDVVKIEIETISDGKVDDPQTIDRVIIYYIEIKPGTPNAKFAMSSSSLVFNDAQPIMIIGNRDIPAWQHGKESIISQIQPGIFQFDWNTSERTEGTYLLFWEWTSNEQTLHANKVFYLNADKTQIMSPDSNLYTPKDKYKMLLNRYMPSMYKSKIKDADKTPEILEKLNDCMAEGFTILEDLANCLGCMLDSNLSKKSILPLLANTFNLKLRTNDHNRWRAQIKRATQLHKRKGTLYGLYEALDHAGIHLTKLTKLWQVASAYKQTDAFVIRDDFATPSVVGNLSKHYITIEEVKIKSSHGDFLDVPTECIMILPPTEPTDKHSVIWQGSSQRESIDLFAHDVLLITYKVKNIPPERQTIEDYIKSLPLADDRPDTTPTKNWNIRLIEDDDPLFNTVIPTRHPFVKNTVFGQIRTKFLYSEQVYNMDTYNGSLRESFFPCDLDNTFYDQCTACQSSYFNVDLEIEDLSEERIQEAKEIIKEYSPFHAKLHYINIAGAVNEFVLPPQENIECLVQTGVPKQLTEVKQAEAIDYIIEWADGSKEKNKV